MSVPLSVLVLTKNEERNIGACLDSVAGWASDIVVVDSGSEDRTLAICAEHGVRTVYPRVCGSSQPDHLGHDRGPLAA